MKTIDRHLNNYNFAVILSAVIQSLDDTANRSRSETLISCLTKTDETFICIDGVYEGNTEKSVIVFCNNYCRVAELELLGLGLFDQHCVLVIDLKNDVAVLKYQNNVALIGKKFERVDSVEGITTGYSIIEGDYWAVTGATCEL